MPEPLYAHGAVKIYRGDDGSVIEVPYTVEYLPDTQAASLWQRNRRRKLWRDKHEINVTDAGADLPDGLSGDQLIERVLQRREMTRRRSK